MAEPEYQISWVTDHIAVGGAPLSYEQLKRIKAEGVNAILNLCAEYCDLQGIEQDYGFEVHYLPIDDEAIPSIANLERAMRWMDEAISRDKRVLVHCRLGIGRTGTVIYAYLASRGLAGKLQDKALKNLRCQPASYCQWQLVRKYRRTSSAGIDSSWPARFKNWSSRLVRRFNNYLK